MLRKSLEERGLVFLMPAQTQAILGDDHVDGACASPTAPSSRPIWS